MPRRARLVEWQKTAYFYKKNLGQGCADMKGTGFCRPMKRGEEAAVTDLLARAFGAEDEVALVQALRNEGAMAGEMVLPGADGEIVGYYALSAMRAPEGWLCLAPVAVDPGWQGQGHGRRMIGQLTAWAAATMHYVVVLGQVGFYARAGFDPARAARLQSPYPAEHMLLAGPGADVPDCALIYPAAFDAL